MNLAINRRYNLRYRLKNIDCNYILKIVAKIFVFIFLFFFLFQLSIFSAYTDKIHKKIDEIDDSDVAIVFGSYTHTQPEVRFTKMIEDRILTAIELYKKGKIEKILISANSRFVNFDEITAMKNLLISNNIPEFVIIEDRKSYSTYSTCWRAKKVYNINRAILVTQEFNQPQALYTCNSLGIEAEGLIADKNIYEDIKWLYIKEQFDMINTFIEVMITRPTVGLL